MKNEVTSKTTIPYLIALFVILPVALTPAGSVVVRSWLPNSHGCKLGTGGRQSAMARARSPEQTGEVIQFWSGVATRCLKEYFAPRAKQSASSRRPWPAGRAPDQKSLPAGRRAAGCFLLVSSIGAERGRNASCWKNARSRLHAWPGGKRRFCFG